MRTVIFGGTFDPIHIGHIAMIRCAMKKLKPDRFIIMPTHIPPHKSAKSLTSDEDRLKMLRLALKGIKGVEISDYEMKRQDVSYTVNTLEHFHEICPEDDLYFLMGSDMLCSFLNWYRTDRIMELCTLVAVARCDLDKERIQKSAAAIRKAGGRAEIIDCKAVDVSSTDLRSRLFAYRRSDGLTPKAVEKYIIKNGLYNFDKSKYNMYVGYLKKTLSDKRFVHSLNVADEALRLSYLNGCDPDKAYLAGLLHDACKELPKDEQLALVKRSKFPVTDVELEAPKTHHGIAASVFLEEEFGICDEEVLSAIRYHTVAKGSMSILEKIIYMADLVSAERDYPDVEKVREDTFKDIDIGLYDALVYSVGYSASHSRTIPVLTLDAYNDAVRYKNSVFKDR